MHRAPCNSVLTLQDRATRQKLFMALLRVYLVPEPGKKEYVPEAIALLNSHLADLDVAKVRDLRTYVLRPAYDLAKVLALVPSKWSIGAISKFLKRSVRISMHAARTSHIEESLARCTDPQCLSP